MSQEHETKPAETRNRRCSAEAASNQTAKANQIGIEISTVSEQRES